MSKPFDGVAFGREMVAFVKDYISKETLALAMQVRALEDQLAIVSARCDLLASENATLIELVSEAEVKAGANPQHAHI